MRGGGKDHLRESSSSVHEDNRGVMRLVDRDPAGVALQQLRQARPETKDED